MLAAKGTKFSDLFGILLVMAEVIRRLLADEYVDQNEEQAVQKFNQALEKTETAIYRAAGRLVEIGFDSQFGKLIQ